MKKLTIILTILLYASCSTTTETITPVVVEIVPRNVEIVLTTNAPSFDEIWVTYKDFDLTPPEQDVFGARQFDYDNSGNPEPIIISLPDYKYRKIEGNSYRNNDLPYMIKAQIYIDNELVLSEESVGSEGIYATINFNYTIPN
jgi:hypothetical protein|tara:strand:+ start:113 stop:541 length:429 start_codon:yes stop_codon:yes gene_type:complete